MVNVDRLKAYLDESDDVKASYLYNQVETAQKQVVRGEVSDSVAGALVSYAEEMEFVRSDTVKVADKLRRVREQEETGFVFGEEVDESMTEVTRELLIQLNADAIAQDTEDE